MDYVSAKQLVWKGLFKMKHSKNKQTKQTNKQKPRVILRPKYKKTLEISAKLPLKHTKFTIQLPFKNIFL